MSDRAVNVLSSFYNKRKKWGRGGIREWSIHFCKKRTALMNMQIRVESQYDWQQSVTLCVYLWYHTNLPFVVQEKYVWINVENAERTICENYCFLWLSFPCFLKSQSMRNFMTVRRERKFFPMSNVCVWNIESKKYVDILRPNFVLFCI